MDSFIHALAEHSSSRLQIFPTLLNLWVDKICVLKTWIPIAMDERPSYGATARRADHYTGMKMDILPRV